MFSHDTEATGRPPTDRPIPTSGDEIVDDGPTIRGQRGHPGGLGARARGPVPDRDRRADARARPLRGDHPRGLRRLGLDLLTYIGIIEELAYGWMSLTGIVNTHTMVATLLMAHGNEEQRQRWLPDHGHRRAPGGPLPVRARRGQRHPQHLLPGHAGRRRVRRQRHQGVGDQRRAAGIVALAARTDEGISAFIVEKEPGPTLRGDLGQQERRQARLQGGRDGGDGLRRTTGSPPATSSARPGGAFPRSSACSRWAASTSPPGPSAWPGPPSTPRWTTPSSARPSASPSPSTRPSSSSWPTWPPGWRRRAS